MKRLFFSIFPIPADALINLYHPWRDLTLDGFNPGRFPAKNTLITDPILQTYPLRDQIIDVVTNKMLPLWNPYNFAGQPLLANIQSGAFQITNLLFLVLPFNWAWALSVIIPSILAGIFMYLFLRTFLSKISSLFASIVLPLSGFYVAWLEWGTIVTTAMWLPLILLSINKLLVKSTAKWFLILTFSLFQTLVSGHLQTAIYVLAASALYFAFFAWRKNIKLISFVLISFVLSLTIAAPQLFPTAEFISLSARGSDQVYNSARPDWFLPPQHLVQIIAPDYFGNPTTNNYTGVFNYGEFVSYLGIIPLFLALLAIFTKSNKFFLMLAAVALLLAVKNPISQLPYTLNLPLISSTQPSRIIFLLAFSLSVLSAYGLENFVKSKVNIKLIVLAFAPLIILVLLYLLSKSDVSTRNLILPILLTASLVAIVVSKLKVKKEIILVAIFAITIFDLFRFAHKFLPFSKQHWIFPQTSTTQFLQNQQKPFRVITTDRMMMHPAANSVYQIESVDGYDPLYLKNYAQYVSVWLSQDPNTKTSSFGRIITPQKYESNFADLLNVEYVLALNDIENPKLSLVHKEGETRVYENKNALPRAFFAQEVVKKNSDEGEFGYLTSNTFDSTVVTSQDIESKKVASQSNVQITNYNSQQVELSATTDVDAPLLLANVNYPGWKAYIDDQKVTIHRGDYLFQLVMVPTGSHDIVFKYEPESFKYGLYLFAFGIAATGLVSLYIWRKKSL